MTKILQTVGIEGIYLNIIMGIEGIYLNIIKVIYDRLPCSPKGKESAYDEGNQDLIFGL